MSTVSSSANRYVTFYRDSAYVLPATPAAASMSLSTQLQEPAFVQVTVAGGTTGSGTVLVSGTAPGGASQSETLTFANNGTQVTAKRYETVTSLTTTGLADEATVPTIAVQSVSADGTPQMVRSVVVSDKPALLSWSGWMKVPAYPQGTKEDDGALLLMDYEEVWTPRTQDIVTEAGRTDQWIVVGVREQFLGYGVRPHHWYMRIDRYQT